jgi:hypothetical protein
MTIAIAYLVGSAALGIAMVRAHDDSSSIGTAAGLGILLGLAFPPVVLFALSLAGVRWTLDWLIVLQLTAGGAILAAAFRWRPPRVPERHEASWAAALLDVATIVLVAGYVVLATNAPTPEADFVTIWGLKGKTFFVSGGIDWAFLSNRWNSFAHVDYPILLPLMFDSVALSAGAWDERAIGFLYAMFGAATVLVVRGSVTRATGSRFLGSTAAIASVPIALSPYIGLGEGPLIAYGTAGLLLLRRGFEEDNQGFVRFGAVMLGLAALVKNEGLSLVIAAILATAVVVRSRKAVVALWPAIAIPLPWIAVRLSLGLSTDLAQGSVLARMREHLANPASYLEALARYPAGNVLLWLGIAAALALAAHELLARERFLLFAVAFQYLFLIGAYFATPHSIDWHFRTSWERVMSQMTLPLVVLAVIGLAAYVRRNDPSEANQ